MPQPLAILDGRPPTANYRLPFTDYRLRPHPAMAKDEPNGDEEGKGERKNGGGGEGEAGAGDGEQVAVEADELEEGTADRISDQVQPAQIANTQPMGAMTGQPVEEKKRPQAPQRFIKEGGVKVTEAGVFRQAIGRFNMNGPEATAARSAQARAEIRCRQE